MPVINSINPDNQKSEPEAATGTRGPAEHQGHAVAQEQEPEEDPE